MKTVVTHLSPDLDSITACWLIKRYLPDAKDATIVFVPAGSTLDNQPPDANSNIIHVDTGLGQFDHHHTSEYTSATQLVFQYLNKNHFIRNKDIKALERMVNFVNDIDHFGEVNFPEPASDRYDFNLYQIIEGLKSIVKDSTQLIELIFPMLDAIAYVLKNKINAEDEIKKGLVFQSHWGKSLAIATANEEATKLALKMGFSLVVRKDPDRGYVRIKTLPKPQLDLTLLYKNIVQQDKKATWFLHVSKNMLLNSSSKNPHFIPSSLSLNQLIKIIKGV